jgi:hypothetical protein
LIGALLLVVPAIHGFESSKQGDAYDVFGTVWIGVVVAAALGNYPTPLVGYGGSAVLGYLLSLASIGPVAASRGVEAPSGERPQGADTVRGSLRAA